MFKNPHFNPLPLLSSPHLQMILASFGPKGKEPPSSEMRIDIGSGDFLSCQVSESKEDTPTIVLLHGLGGSHRASYMVRLARKLFQYGFRVVRVNLRNCGSGAGLSRLPYNAGTSGDVKCVLEALKKRYPQSPLILIGYSLGGNLAIKLCGEMGDEAGSLLHHAIAVCPVLSLADCIHRIETFAFGLYQPYYLNAILAQSKEWIKGKDIRSIYQYDTEITAPYWGYLSAEDYFEKCSSVKFIEKVQIPFDILLAKDDPFVDYRIIEQKNLNPSTTIWLSDHGSHTGFIGRSHGKSLYWLDQFLLNRTNL